MLRDQPEDAAIVDYCKALQADLASQIALGEPVRALLDLKPAKAATKRWGWVKKGAPVVIEVGGRDVAAGNVSVIVRSSLYREDGKLDSRIMPRDEFVGGVATTLSAIQDDLFAEADARMKAAIAPVDDWADIEAMFADTNGHPGWADVRWSKPTGAALDTVVERLKALKLTIRNAPMGQTGRDEGPCIFTGAPAVERVLIGRAY
jgi:prolyl-tRNA synthetase